MGLGLLFGRPGSDQPFTRDWPWVAGSVGSGARSMVPALPSALNPEAVGGQEINTGKSQLASAIDLLSDKEKRRLVRGWRAVNPGY